jgi:hypothetical protein
LGTSFRGVRTGAVQDEDGLQESVAFGDIFLQWEQCADGKVLLASAYGVAGFDRERKGAS